MNKLYVSIPIMLIACNSDDGLKAYNSQPVVTITSHTDGAEIQDGYVITFVGQVSDANHQNSDVLVTWSTNNGELCTDIVPEESGETACEAVLTEDDTEIRLQAVDPEGGAGIQTISVTIIPTEAPTATIISPLPSGVYYSDQKITFEALVEDEEDDSDQLVAAWTSDLNGELDVDAEVNSAGTTIGYGYLTQGEHAIEVYVEDTTGKSDTESVIINVGPPNSAPLCEITAPTTGSAGPENQNIDFMASVSDVDISSNLLTVTWISDKDGELGTSTPNSSGDVLFSYSALSVNTHTVTMTVTDEIGTSCTDFVSYTVGTPPEVTLESPANGDIFSEGENIIFSATVSDAQDQPDEISLDWVLNGTSVSTQGATSSGTASWLNSSLPPGNHTLVVTATDTDGLNDSTQTIFTINGIPSAPEISITPDPATTSDQITVHIDVASVDPEGSTVSYSYEWFKNNILQNTQTTQSISASDTEKDDTWKVRVIPNDGTSDGDAAEAQITISNSLPVITSVSITPIGNAYNDDVLSCVGAAYDPDETLSISYEWHLNSTMVGSGTNLDLMGLGAMPQDNITCSATVTDNGGISASGIAIKMIGNRIPNFSGSTITPNTNITTSSLLTCSTTVQDADGETISPSFSWLIGSNSYTGSTLQLDSTMVSPGDGVMCQPHAQDGYGGSATDSVSVVVENTPPEITATISVSGSGNSAELTCTGIASDADDSITPTITYEWFDNSNSSLGSTNPLQLSSTTGVGGDNISCVATATDSSGDSTSTTAVHTITNTAPTTPIISLTPDPAVAGQDDLVCSVDTTSIDSDGNTVVYTYVWTDDLGTIQQTTTETTAVSDTFLASGTSAGIWTCEVTPYDMTDYGASDSASITIDSGGVDFDGDGFYEDEDCDDNDASLNYSDSDGDGVTSCDGDCDDNDSSRSPDLSEVCDGIDNDCDGSIPSDEIDNDNNGIIDCSEGWSTTGYNIEDFDVAHDGSITAISYDSSTGDIHALCFDPSGSLTNSVLIETINVNLYRSNQVRVGRAAETHESAIGWNFRSRFGQDWRSRHAHLDADCEIVAPAAKLDVALGSGLLRRVSVEISDHGTSAFVYENQTAGEFRLLYFDETGTLINARNFGSSECGTGALTRVLGMNKNTGDVIVGCESTSPGLYRYYQRFDSVGNPIDTQMVLVSNASGTGSWHNFNTQMNDNGEFVYLAATSSGWSATFYDSSGVEVASVITGTYSQNDKIIATSTGDFVLGGTSNREVYSPQGTLLGSSTDGGKIRLDESDIVYDFGSSTVYNPFPLY